MNATRTRFRGPRRTITAWKRGLIALLFCPFFFVGAGASAQESFDRGQCTVAPLTISDLARYATTSPDPDRVSTPVDPTGAPVSDSTVAQITDTIEMSVACANANDPLRALALFTPAYLTERFGGDRQDDLGHLIAALTRDPAVAPAEDRLTLISIDNVRILPDGRVAAVVVTENASVRFTDDVVLAKVEDAWRIDQVVLGDVSAIGTPVSSSAIHVRGQSIG